MNNNLPVDYEPCSTCGYDHGYDCHDYIAWQNMITIHSAENETNARNFMNINNNLFDYEDAFDLAADCCAYLGLYEYDGNVPTWMNDMARDYFVTIH